MATRVNRSSFHVMSRATLPGKRGTPDTPTAGSVARTPGLPLDGPFPPCCFRVYGTTLESDLALPARPLSRIPAPDLRVACTPETLGWPSGGAGLYASQHLTRTGESVLSLHAGENGLVLRFCGVSYLLGDEHVLWNAGLASDRRLVEIGLLGPVLSLWLEHWRATPALHASAVATEDGAVAFLASTHGGKSVLAAALACAGYPLVSDDILPLLTGGSTVLAVPGYPQMRLWPQEARHLLGDTAGLERVRPDLEKLRIPVGAGGFGRFCEHALRLACIYLPQRCDSPADGGTIEIAPLPPSVGLMELVRHSFGARMLAPLGLESRRLPLLAEVARRVPLRRLHYPAGLMHLERVGHAVIADVQRLAG